MTTTITATELMARLGEPGLLLVDVRPKDVWAAETIPGAISLNVYDYFIPASNESGLSDIAAAAYQAMSRSGIAAAETVVYFEEETGMISPRGLWFHEFLGLDGGLILDGGIKAWKAAGGAVAPGAGVAEEIVSGAVPAPAAPPVRQDLIALFGDVLDRDPEAVDLLDVRRRSEFEGSFVHPCCDRAGRLPDAKFLFWEDFLSGGRYRPASEIADLAKQAGLDPSREVITYCHRGARAATALYGLRRAGFHKVRVFVGSWHEWASRPDLPIETGDPGEAHPA